MRDFIDCISRFEILNIASFHSMPTNTIFLIGALSTSPMERLAVVVLLITSPTDKGNASGSSREVIKEASDNRMLLTSRTVRGQAPMKRDNRLCGYRYSIHATILFARL